MQVRRLEVREAGGGPRGDSGRPCAARKTRIVAFLLRAVALLVTVPGCGALAVDDLAGSRGDGAVDGGATEGVGSAASDPAVSDPAPDDLSSPGTPLLGAQDAPACRRPVAVDVITFEERDGAGILESSEQACYEPSVPAAARWDESDPERSCVTLEPGQSAEIYMDVSLQQDEPAGGFAFEAGTGLVPVHLAVTVEHDQGQLECPAFNGDNYIGFAGWFVRCLLPVLGGSPVSEQCPCAGEAPTGLSSIRRIRWRAVHEGAVSDSGNFCLGNSVMFCGGECVSEP